MTLSTQLSLLSRPACPRPHDRFWPRAMEWTTGTPWYKRRRQQAHPVRLFTASKQGRHAYIINWMPMLRRLRALPRHDAAPARAGCAAPVATVSSSCSMADRA